MKIQLPSTPGRFLVAEGPNYSGKTTFLGLLADELRRRAKTVIITREPGGSKIGEMVRPLLRDPEIRMDPMTETLLFEAIRNEHNTGIITPALEAGTWVLSDRYWQSTKVFQYPKLTHSWQKQAADDLHAQFLWPHLTVFIIPSVETLYQRALTRNGDKDRYENFSREGIRHERDRYIECATEYPGPKLVFTSNEESAALFQAPQFTSLIAA